MHYKKRLRVQQQNRNNNNMSFADIVSFFAAMQSIKRKFPAIRAYYNYLLSIGDDDPSARAGEVDCFKRFIAKNAAAIDHWSLDDWYYRGAKTGGTTATINLRNVIDLGSQETIADFWARLVAMRLTLFPDGVLPTTDRPAGLSGEADRLCRPDELQPTGFAAGVLRGRKDPSDAVDAAPTAASGAPIDLDFAALLATADTVGVGESPAALYARLRRELPVFDAIVADIDPRDVERVATKDGMHDVQEIILKHLPKIFSLVDRFSPDELIRTASRMMDATSEHIPDEYRETVNGISSMIKGMQRGEPPDVARIMALVNLTGVPPPLM
jgi:hypothetical protein